MWQSFLEFLVPIHRQKLDELYKNLKEVVELCLEGMDIDSKEQLPEFVGIQQVEVAG